MNLNATFWDFDFLQPFKIFNAGQTSCPVIAGLYALVKAHARIFLMIKGLLVCL